MSDHPTGIDTGQCYISGCQCGKPKHYTQYTTAPCTRCGEWRASRGVPLCQDCQSADDYQDAEKGESTVSKIKTTTTVSISTDSDGKMTLGDLERFVEMVKYSGGDARRGLDTPVTVEYADPFQVFVLSVTQEDKT